jgi:hypothetical protein
VPNHLRTATAIAQLADPLTATRNENDELEELARGAHMRKNAALPFFKENLATMQ